MSNLNQNEARRYQHMLGALRRRRRMRANLVELLFVVAGAVLGLLLPRISAGPTIPAAGVSTLMATMAAAMVTFIGVVFSLLFMVVQFGSTTWTPRLNLFRDNPLVWRAFGYFVGVVVWAAAAALAASSLDHISVIVPIVGVLLILAGLGVFRKLQMEAFESLQLAPILHSIVDRGRATIDALYQEPYPASPHHQEPLPEVRGEVRWQTRDSTIRQIDLPELVTAASLLNGIVELTVKVGDIVREGQPVAVIRGGTGEIDAAKLIASLEVGLERTMEQEIRFCTTSDGVRIAYATIGAGPPLVRARGWFTHLELEWGE